MDWLEMLFLCDKKDQVWQQAYDDTSVPPFWHMCNQIMFESDIPCNASPAQYLWTCYEHGWGPFAPGGALAEEAQKRVVTIADDHDTLPALPISVETPVPITVESLEHGLSNTVESLQVPLPITVESLEHALSNTVESLQVPLPIAEIPLIDIDETLELGLPSAVESLQLPLPIGDEIPLIDIDETLELTLPNTANPFELLALPEISNLSLILNQIENYDPDTTWSLTNIDPDTSWTFNLNRDEAVEEHSRGVEEDVIWLGNFRKGGVPQHRNCLPGCCRP